MERKGALEAGLAAAIVSGAPSTLYAMATGRSPLEASKAAGAILLPNETHAARLLSAAVVIHLTISLFWAQVLAMTLPRRHRVFWGSAAGFGISVLDIVVIGRRWPRIAELPLGAQIADHVLFGAVVAALLDERSFGSRRHLGLSPGKATT